MKVRTKLFIGFAVIVSLLWAVGLLSWSIFGNLNEQFAVVEEDVIPNTFAMNELDTLSNHIYREVSEYIYHGSEEAKTAAIANLDRLEEIGMEYLPAVATPGMMEHGKDSALAGKIFDFYFSSTWIIDLKERGADYDTILARDRSMSLSSLLAMQEHDDILKAASIASLARAKTSFNKAYRGGLNAIHITAALVTLAGIIACILVTRSIVHPLIALRKGTEAIAQGNLDYKVGTKARDEIGDLSRDFDKMTESLSKSMTSIDNLNREIDERKLAEEAFKESQKFSSSLLENAPHAIVVFNPDTSVRYVNPAWEKANGWTASEIIGTKAPYPWWPEEYREIFHEGFKEAMAQESGSGEVIARKKSGEIYWIDMNWVSVMHDGKPQYTIINSVDTTERKQAEEALRSNEERFRLLADNSTELIARIQILPTIKTDYVSPSCLHITGYTQEEFYNNPDLGLEMIHPEDRKFLQKHVGPDNKNNHVPITVRLVRKDGRTIWIEQTHTTIYNDLGEAIAMHLVSNDITERKHAEEALKDSEERFSKAFNASPDIMGITTLKDGNYIEVNDSFVQFSGYSREELIGHTNQDLNMWVNPEDEEKMGQLLGETGKMRHEEFLFRTKSGEIRTWLCSADIINVGGDPCMLAVATDITERKKALEALHESEERFSKAFHASPGSMSISRLRDGKFIEVNDSFLKDKGYTREEVIGRSSAELGIWKDDEHRNKVLDMLQEQGKVHNELTQFRTKTGELRTGYLSAEFITLGNEPCMIVLTTDITKLRHAEEQLRLLGSVTQQVSDSTIVIDTDFKITYMNQAAVDQFGYTLGEARGKTLGLFDARSMSKKGTEEIRKAITSGKGFKSINTKKRKDGSTLICDCCLSPLYDENGEICSYIDVQRDITQQKEVEAKLQVHKKLIERILATMPEGVLVIGNDDKILLANEAFRKIFHTGKKTISNKPLDEIIPVEQLRNLYKAAKEGNEEKNTLEFRYQNIDIEKRIACVITKMDGERTLITFSDVSQEREEEEKLYLTDRLASIGEMAAGLAHELNNPLTGVLALSQLLMDSDIPEEYREDLECVYNEAKRAASIVKNVLLFARNNNYENGHASANEVVRDVLRLREYEEKVSNITAVTALQDDLPDVPIDKFQLQQVFLNLILNAEAAIRETSKPGTLTVTTERINNHINIHFKDNGCGIDRHTLPRIFDPFFTTKDIGKGTGLGLSICYGIVVKHGGKISVKTNPNKGTTFTIRMPVISHN